MSILLVHILARSWKQHVQGNASIQSRQSLNENDYFGEEKWKVLIFCNMFYVSLHCISTSDACLVGKRNYRSIYFTFNQYRIELPVAFSIKLDYRIIQFVNHRLSDGVFSKCHFLKLVILENNWDPFWGNLFVYHSLHAHPNQVCSWGICPSPALQCANITAAQLKTGYP